MPRLPPRLGWFRIRRSVAFDHVNNCRGFSAQENRKEKLIVMISVVVAVALACAPRMELLSSRNSVAS